MINQEGTIICQGKFATLFAVLLATACAALTPTTAHAQCVATTIGSTTGTPWGTRESIFFDPMPTNREQSVGSLIPSGVAGRIVFTTSSSTSDGTFAWHQEGNSGGVPFVSDLSGTYSVDSATCTGTMTRFDGVKIFFVIVQSATEIDFSYLTSQNPRAEGQRVGQGVMKKQ